MYNYILSLTLGAWGVSQIPSLSVKPSEHHRAGLWGHPSGSNPQRHPSRGYSVTQLHRLYRGDRDSSTPQGHREGQWASACRRLATLGPRPARLERPPLPDEHPFSLQPLWGVGTLPVSGCRPVWPVASAPTRSVHGPQDHRLSHWALHPLASQVAQC